MVTWPAAFAESASIPAVKTSFLAPPQWPTILRARLRQAAAAGCIYLPSCISRFTPSRASLAYRLSFGLLFWSRDFRACTPYCVAIRGPSAMRGA